MAWDKVVRGRCGEALRPAHMRGAAVLLATAVALAAPAAAFGVEDPNVQAIEVSSLVQNQGISQAQASSDIALQDAVSPLIDSIDATIGPSASGDAWFDLARGRFEVGVVSATNPPSGANVDAARTILGNAGVLANTDFVNVAFSANDLMAAQAALDQQLAGQEQAGEVNTGIDPTTNSITVDEASGVNATDDGIIRQAAATAATPSGQIVPVTFTVDNSSDLRGIAAACGFHDIVPPNPTTNWLMCDPPLRGGVALDDGNFTACTLGFNARGSGTARVPLNARVVFTAGHCIQQSLDLTLGGQLPPWESYDAAGNPHNVRASGAQYAYEFDPQGDWGELTNSHEPYWLPTADIYAGSASPDYSIAKDGISKLRMTVCMTSAIPLSSTTTGRGVPDPTANRHATCGQVTGLNKTLCYQVVQGPPVCVQHLVATNITRAVQGSSGGPIYSNHIGRGLVAALTSPPGWRMYYQPIRPVERRDGAYIFGF